MTNDDMLRLLHEPSRQRILFRKLSILILRYVPVVSLGFIVAVCVARLWYYSARGLVNPSRIREIILVDWLFLVLFFLLFILWWLFLLTASHSLGFCRLHRQVITYDLAGYLIIHAGRLIGYGRALPYIIVLLGLLGLHLAAKIHINSINRTNVNRRNARSTGLPNLADEGGLE